MFLIGPVTFARYCGKIYSHHLFPYGGLHLRGKINAFLFENIFKSLRLKKQSKTRKEKKRTQLVVFDPNFCEYTKKIIPVSKLRDPFSCHQVYH